MFEENASTHIDQLDIDELERIELDLIALQKQLEEDFHQEETPVEETQKNETLRMMQEKKEILAQIKNAKELLSLSDVSNGQLTEEQIMASYEPKLHQRGLYPLLSAQQEHNQKLEAARDILLEVVKDPARFEPAGFLGNIFTRVTGKEKYVFGEPSKMLKDSASVTASIAYQRVNETIRAKGPVVLEKSGQAVSILGAKIASAAITSAHAAKIVGSGALHVTQKGCAATGRAAGAVASTTASEYESRTGKKYFPGAITLDTGKAAATAMGSTIKGAAQIASSLYTIFRSGARAAAAGTHVPALTAPASGSDSDVDLAEEQSSASLKS